MPNLRIPPFWLEHNIQMNRRCLRSFPHTGISWEKATPPYFYTKNVMNAFRRTINLGDILVCASTSRKPVHPPRPAAFRPQAQHLVFPNKSKVNTPLVQAPITDFFHPKQPGNNLVTNSCSTGALTRQDVPPPQNTSLMNIRTIPNLIRNACINKNKCRYCPNLERCGKITSTTTGTTYSCKKNFTCKSSI